MHKARAQIIDASPVVRHTLDPMDPPGLLCLVCNRLGRNQVILTVYFYPSLGLKKKMNPRKLQFLQESNARRRKRPGSWCYKSVGLCVRVCVSLYVCVFILQKEISWSSDNLIDHLAGKASAKTMMGQ